MPGHLGWGRSTVIALLTLLLLRSLLLTLPCPRRLPTCRRCLALPLPLVRFKPTVVLADVDAVEASRGCLLGARC